ncbi:hypothetical protein CUP1378 [Campylobacter upsaliensis RM3195]|nr:hypothetical protein CUP1378 [Campylobacter upsaliensis RM3195]
MQILANNLKNVLLSYSHKNKYFVNYFLKSFKFCLFVTIINKLK